VSENVDGPSNVFRFAMLVPSTVFIRAGRRRFGTLQIGFMHTRLRSPPVRRLARFWDGSDVALTQKRREGGRRLRFSKPISCVAHPVTSGFVQNKTHTTIIAARCDRERDGPLQDLLRVCEVRLTLLQKRLGVPQRQPEKSADLITRERTIAIAFERDSFERTARHVAPRSLQTCRQG
jgi:hypothetical protein